MQSEGKNEKTKHAPLLPRVSAKDRGENFYTVHASPTQGTILFNFFSHFHPNQTIKIKLLPPHFLPFPFFPLQITSTKHNLSVCLKTPPSLMLEGEESERKLSPTLSHSRHDVRRRRSEAFLSLFSFIGRSFPYKTRRWIELFRSYLGSK